MQGERDIAPTLTSLRVALGYSLKDVAAQVHVSAEAVRQWEAGRMAPDVFHAARLAEVLGITVAHLTEILAARRAQAAAAVAGR